jgi:hypothetical protein
MFFRSYQGPYLLIVISCYFKGYCWEEHLQDSYQLLDCS